MLKKASIDKVRSITQLACIQFLTLPVWSKLACADNNSFTTSKCPSAEAFISAVSPSCVSYKIITQKYKYNISSFSF